MQRSRLMLLVCLPILSSFAWSQTLPPTQYMQYGNSVAGAGDVNGDGWPDVIVGAHGWDGEGGVLHGRAYIHFGGPDGIHRVADVVLSGEAMYDDLGWSVDGAGDVNGDTYSDVIVGARYQ